MKICSKCGSINSDGSNNCNKCGNPLGNSIHRPASQTINNKPTLNTGNNQSQSQPQYPIHQQQQTQRNSFNGTTTSKRKNKNSFLKYAIGCFACISLLVIAGIIYTLSSNKIMTDSEIDEAYGSGVVLIMNSGYYEIVLSNGESVYFTSYDEENGLQNFTSDKDSIVTAYSFGTGFFVSDDGKIATNNHVVSSDVTEKQIKKQMNSLFSKIKEALSDQYDEYKELDEQLLSSIRQKYLDDEDYSTEYTLSDAVEEEMEKLKEMYKYVDDINPSELELKYHSEVSVACNNTYVTNISDFSPCIIKSTDSEYDLAIIQLKDKKTPNDKYVFSVPVGNPLEEYSLPESLGKKFGRDKNSKLTMIGFNRGPQLAFTNEGIKAQTTSGSISQNDDDKIMYSIPSLHGSSGSPVLNAKGQLVAVNFAGIDVTQSFNYGIKVKHLRDLLNK